MVSKIHDHHHTRETGRQSLVVVKSIQCNGAHLDLYDCNFGFPTLCGIQTNIRSLQNAQGPNDSEVGYLVMAAKGPNDSEVEYLVIAAKGPSDSEVGYLVIAVKGHRLAEFWEEVGQSRPTSARFLFLRRLNRS